MEGAFGAGRLRKEKGGKKDSVFQGIRRKGGVRLWDLRNKERREIGCCPYAGYGILTVSKEESKTMADIMIHRGSSQIGGCCTEISTGESRILIDFGANLPGTDETAETKDSEMVSKVFGESRESAVLFTHYHGDHYGLFKKIPKDIPVYIGSLAKDILRILAPYLDREEKEKGLPAVERMGTYEAGK